MADINSSDVELSDVEDVPRRVPKAVESIIAKSVTDRIESKKKSKRLTDAASSPATANARGYWYALFEAFAVNTLQIQLRAV